MAMWNRCAICGRAIPVGELCYGVKNWHGDPDGGDTICMDCLVPENAPTLTPQNEWVSVEEKLPDEELKRFKELFPEENEVEVLVMIQGAYTATTLYWDGERFYDEARSYKVTHWMPLPKSPKEDE